MKPHVENEYSSGTIGSTMIHNRTYQEIVQDCIYHIIILRNRERFKPTIADFIELYEGTA